MTEYQKRLEAEMYLAQLQADRQSQHQQFAEFMGQAMQNAEQQKLHGKYSAMKRGKHVFSMPATPQTDPEAEVHMLQKQLDQERELSTQKIMR